MSRGARARVTSLFWAAIRLGLIVGPVSCAHPGQPSQQPPVETQLEQVARFRASNHRDAALAARWMTRIRK